MKSYNYSDFKRKQPRHSRKRFYILFLISSILIFSYYVIFISSLFNVTDVSSKGLIEADVVRMNENFSQKLLGKKIFFVRDALIQEFASSIAPDYKFIKVSKVYPGKIIIELEKREAAVVVKAANGSFIIDKKNFVMGAINSFVGYEINVEYDKDLAVGKHIEDQNLINAFKYAGSYGIVKVENNLISVGLNEGGKVLLPEKIDTSEIENLSITLQKIIQKYRIENKEVDTIDLRFSKPLIKYK
jgi:cell division septal protein FtsQ